MPDFPPAVILRSPRDLVGMVPYLLGFHPAESVVAVYVGADRQVKLISRLDLDAPADIVVDTLHRAARDDTATVTLVGYGPRTAAARLTAVADRLAAHIAVTGVFLVSGRRFVCLTCRCEATGDGMPFDAATTATAARSTVAGLVALPTRADLVGLVRADSIEQAAVEAAIANVQRDDLGTAALRRLLGRAADGIRLPTADVARLVMMLRHVGLRDMAWHSTAASMWQRDLWLDVTRRTPDRYVAAPASLAAWCAWMRGEETLAAAAVDRALTADPRYAMAQLIRQAVAGHVPASDLITTWPPAGSRSPA